MNQDTPLPNGKLPPEFLAELISAYVDEDASFIVRPGVGEVTAAVRAPDEGVLVLKSDPITFATDRIGYYSVLVNANDIATSGAVPRWLLVTLLLPEGSKAGKVWEIMRDLHDLCAKLGIALCGGHTEITDGVTRPIVSATLIGTVKRKSLVRKADIATGDAVILTKGVSVEGTSILCREFGFRLIELGMSGKMVKRGAEFLSRISVLQEAKAAVESGWVTGMHDVTEGGLATAITELSEATRKRFLIDIVRIPFYPETVTACDLLGIDPLGLIGSGSLIICCVGDKADALRALLEERGIEAAVIGVVGEDGTGVAATRKGKPVPWPVFPADELTRLFGRKGE